jgi:hypothetical protein
LTNSTTLDGQFHQLSLEYKNIPRHITAAPIHLDQLLQICHSGDLLLFRSPGLLPSMQRTLLQSSYDHVGMIVRLDLELPFPNQHSSKTNEPKFLASSIGKPTSASQLRSSPSASSQFIPQQQTIQHQHHQSLHSTAPFLLCSIPTYRIRQTSREKYVEYQIDVRSASHSSAALPSNHSIISNSNSTTTQTAQQSTINQHSIKHKHASNIPIINSSASGSFVWCCC